MVRNGCKKGERSWPEIPGELSAAALTSILRQFVTESLNRNAAATMTVAFEMRRAGCLSRGEKISEQQVKEEIRKIYYNMLGVTDPEIGVEQARQAAQKQP